MRILTSFPGGNAEVLSIKGDTVFLKPELRDSMHEYYKVSDLANYDDVVANFRMQLAKFNAEALIEAKGEASFTDDEFERVLIHVENHSVYESAKILRDKYVLTLDNGEQVYLDFFSSNTDRNIYQVTHQVTMDKAHKDDVVYKNRYDAFMQSVSG